MRGRRKTRSSRRTWTPTRVLLTPNITRHFPWYLTPRANPVPRARRIPNGNPHHAETLHLQEFPKVNYHVSHCLGLGPAPRETNAIIRTTPARLPNSRLRMPRNPHLYPRARRRARLNPDPNDPCHHPRDHLATNHKCVNISRLEIVPTVTNVIFNILNLVI